MCFRGVCNRCVLAYSVPAATSKPHENTETSTFQGALEVLHGASARASRAGYAGTGPREHPRLRALAGRPLERRPDVRRPGRVPGPAGRRPRRGAHAAGRHGVRNPDGRAGPPADRRRRQRATTGSAGAGATRAEPLEVASDASLFALDASKFDGGRGVVLLIASNGEGRTSSGRRSAATPTSAGWSPAPCRWGSAWRSATARSWCSSISGVANVQAFDACHVLSSLSTRAQRRCRVIAGTATVTDAVEKPALMAGAANVTLFPFTLGLFESELGRLEERLGPRKTRVASAPSTSAPPRSGACRQLVRSLRMEGESPFRRHVAWGLCCVAYLVVSPYFERLNNPNENVRVWATRAVVTHHVLHIDEVEREWGYVNDKAKNEHHVYSGKAPGASFVGVPVLWVHTKLRQLVGWPAARQARDDVLAAAVRGQAAALRVPVLLRALRAAGDRFELGARRRGHRAGAGDDAVPVREPVRRARAGGGGGVRRVHAAGCGGRRRPRAGADAAAHAAGRAARRADRDVRVPGGAGVDRARRSTRSCATGSAGRRWRRSSRGRCRRRSRSAPYHTALFGRPWRFPFGNVENPVFARDRAHAPASTGCRCRTVGVSELPVFAVVRAVRVLAGAGAGRRRRRRAVRARAAQRATRRRAGDRRLPADVPVPGGHEQLARRLVRRPALHRDRRAVPAVAAAEAVAARGRTLVGDARSPSAC